MPRTRKPATKRLNARLTPEEMDKLQMYAEQENMSITEVVRQWIRHAKLKPSQ